VLRNRVNVTTAVVGVCAVALIPVVGVFVISDGQWSVDAGTTWGLVGLVAVAALTLWAKLVRTCVVADSDGVLVIDEFARGRVLPWSDIASITVELGPLETPVPQEALVIRTSTGGTVAPDALRSGIGFGWSKPGHRWLEHCAAALNAARPPAGE
jgi:hypothetical protein